MSDIDGKVSELLSSLDPFIHLSDKMEKHYLVIHIKNRFEIYSESLINLYNFQNLSMVWIHSGMRR